MSGKNLLLIVLVFVAVDCAAQPSFSAPDMKYLLRVTADKSSPFYHPLLLKRFQEADTTMTLEEKRAVYYGFSGTDDYSPYGMNDLADSIRTLLRQDDLSEADQRLILTLSDSVLRADPFDMQTTMFRAYCAKQLGMKSIRDTAVWKLRAVAEVLQSTGDGRTQQTAFWVLSVAHEYWLLEMLGFRFGSSQTLTDKMCDYLKVQKNEEGIAGLYFNVSIGFNAMSRMFSNSLKDD